LVSSSAAATRVAQQATKTITIIMLASFDPVEAGAVSSLAHPGGNITGITRFNDELTGKRFELLKGSGSEAITRRSSCGGWCFEDE